jgi:hypothetical protein
MADRTPGSEETATRRTRWDVYAKTAAPMAKTRPPKEMALPDAAPTEAWAGPLDVGLADLRGVGVMVPVPTGTVELPAVG